MKIQNEQVLKKEGDHWTFNKLKFSKFKTSFFLYDPLKYPLSCKST